MALTLADFMKITTQKEEESRKIREEEKKIREEERNADKADRAVERTEHIAAITRIIETGVRDEVK